MSQGSIAKKVEDEFVYDKLSNLAKKVAENINLKFGSVDIIETVDNELYVLEVNSGVMVENYIRLNPNEYELIKEMYKQAVDKLFKNI